MKEILSKLLGRAADLTDVEPLIALFLGAALLAVFLSVFVRPTASADPAEKASVFWSLCTQARRLVWALTLVGVLVASVSVLRIYLHQSILPL